MKYKVATLKLVGDEGYYAYSDIEEIEAKSEKQAIFFYEKKHGISYYESHIAFNGRCGAIYNSELDDFQSNERNSC